MNRTKDYLFVRVLHLPLIQQFLSDILSDILLDIFCSFKQKRWYFFLFCNLEYTSNIYLNNKQYFNRTIAMLSHFTQNIFNMHKYFNFCLKYE